MEWTAADVLTFFGLLGGLTAFFAGLIQYRKAQQWKRAEWIAQEMKAFFDQPQVQNALYMIDWGKRRIPLFPMKAPEERYVEVSDDTVKMALTYHEEHGPFTEEEEAIRDSFDCFLFGLERFESYVGARLIKGSDLAPYLSYWSYHIAAAKDDDPKVDRLVQLRKYIATYGYAGAERLIARLHKSFEIQRKSP